MPSFKHIFSHCSSFYKCSITALVYPCFAGKEDQALVRSQRVDSVSSQQGRSLQEGTVFVFCLARDLNTKLNQAVFAE